MQIIKFKTIVKLLNTHRTSIETLRLCSQSNPAIEILAKPSKIRKKQVISVGHDVVNYFQEENLQSYLKFLPQKLLQKKHKPSEQYYVVHPETAKSIAQYLHTYLNYNLPLIEVNPGLGLLTNELIKLNVSDLRLIEVFDEFMPELQEKFVAKYRKRIQLKSGDFIGLWKMYFLDKIDNKNRIGQFLFGLPTVEWDKGINIQVFACTGSLNIIKHLINAIVLQNSIMAYGRCDLFLVMPAPLYIHLTCNKDAGYMIYRSTSILFQIMFEHRFIAKLPRRHFVPWQFEPKLDKMYKLAKLNSIDPESVYLVRIRPREDIYQKCYPEHIQALWFFIKQNCVSRKNRVIPSLEKWIPGAGPRLIINTKETELSQPMYPDEDIDELPQLSTQSTTISTQDYCNNINIFTQFGDLTPAQILTIFDQFKSWPGYKDSPFLALMENCFMKMETSVDDPIDGLEINEDMDYDKSELTQIKKSLVRSKPLKFL